MRANAMIGGQNRMPFRGLLRGKRSWEPWSEIVAIERTAPLDRDRYARRLEAVVSSLRDEGPAARDIKGALVGWLQQELAEFLAEGSENECSARSSALHDVAVDGKALATSLQKVIRTVPEAEVLNLRSYFHALIDWRAKDIIRSVHGRHNLRLVPQEPESLAEHPDGRPLFNEAVARVIVEKLFRSISEDSQSSQDTKRRYAGVLAALLDDPRRAEVKRQLGMSTGTLDRTLKALQGMCRSLGAFPGGES